MLSTWAVLSDARGGWCGGSSAPVGAPRFVPGPAPEYVSAPTWEWRSFPDDEEQIALLYGGKQVGGYNLVEGYYRPYADSTWGEKQVQAPTGLPQWAKDRAAKLKAEKKPKVVGKDEKPKKCGCDCGCGQSGKCDCRDNTPPPTKCGCKHDGSCKDGKCDPTCKCLQGINTDDCPNFGINCAKLKEDGLGYSINGVQVSREVFLGQLEGTGPGPVPVPDDAKQLCVTVVGPDAQRKQVIADIAASEWKDKVRVQEYAPGEWALACGFPADPFYVLVQGSDGVALHLQKDYDGGIQQLVEAIRKADPNFKPDLTPDLRKPKPSPAPGPSPDEQPVDLMPACCVAGVLGLFVLLARRKSS